MTEFPKGFIVAVRPKVAEYASLLRPHDIEASTQQEIFAGSRPVDDV
jgi:hypothetical protein